MPRKVLKHFPIIPRLKQMFMTPNLSTLMWWHHDNKSTNGLVCHVIDLKTWAHIDSSWPNFITEPRNVMFGLV